MSGINITRSKGVLREMANGERLQEDIVLKPWGFSSESRWRISNVNGLTIRTNSSEEFTIPNDSIYTRISGQWVATQDSASGIAILQSTPDYERRESIPDDLMYTRISGQWVATQDSEFALAMNVAITPAKRRAGGNTLRLADDAPDSNNGAGDLFMDNQDTYLKYWSSHAWYNVSSTIAQYHIDIIASNRSRLMDAPPWDSFGGMHTYFQDEAPSTAEDNDLWIHPTGETITRGVAKEYNHPELGNRLAYFQDEAPSTAEDGDLWLDTNDTTGEILYRGLVQEELQEALMSTATPRMIRFNLSNIAGGLNEEPSSYERGYIFYYYPARPRFSNEVKVEIFSNEINAEMGITSHVYNLIF